MTVSTRLKACALVAALAFAPALARADELPGAPAAPAPSTQPATQPRSRAMYATGVVLAATGFTATAVGLLVLFTFRMCSDSDPPHCTGLPELGVPLLAGGVALAAVGIPLWVIGREPVARPAVSRIAVSAGSGTSRVVVSGSF